MRRRPLRLAGLALALGLCAGGAARAAEPVPAQAGWSWRIVPYGWLTAIDGTQTVRGRSARIDASFADIVSKSDSLVALMGVVEARSGPHSFYGDLVWTRIGLKGGGFRSLTLAPGVTATVDRSLSLDVQMTILEVGTAHEVARFGALKVDLLAGLRYWRQQADLSVATLRTADLADLDWTGARAVARSGGVSWVDPLVGLRLRHAPAPGHELFLRADAGGFGIGSVFSWQVVGGYGFDFAARGGTVFSGMIGYRALSVDYRRGAGLGRYVFDAVQHGPVLGVAARF